MAIQCKRKIIASLLSAIYLISASGALAQIGEDLTDVDRLKKAGLVRSEFIFETASFPSCHASTIVQANNTLVAAWFGGTEERDPDVGIWVSRNEGAGWSTPEEVANGIQHASKRYPTWNPVLYQPTNGPLLLFFKAGPSPSAWWGMLTTSEDEGRTWSFPQRLPEDIIGPVKNKPIQLTSGALLCPSSSEHDGWQIHFELTEDLGKTWERFGPVSATTIIDAIQPSILTYADGRMQVLCRSRQGVLVQSWSDDGGRSWSPLTFTGLPNPNSGTDALTLTDGRQLVVYNHVSKPEKSWGGPRTPLNVAVSADGINWNAAIVLEDAPGEYSYPAVIQARDGLVHVTYTWQRRRIKHVVLDPTALDLRPMPDGTWPE